MDTTKKIAGRITITTQTKSVASALTLGQAGNLLLNRTYMGRKIMAIATDQKSGAKNGIISQKKPIVASISMPRKNRCSNFWFMTQCFSDDPNIGGNASIVYNPPSVPITLNC